MRAFVVLWRTILSFYGELFLLVGMSTLWWLTGGISLVAVILFGWPMIQVGGPWWLMPLLAIPAGPATAALAHMLRRTAREQRADRSYFWEGFRLYWRKALALGAIAAASLSMVLLNVIFYFSQEHWLLRALTALWLYLFFALLGILLYLFPVLVGLEKPTIASALRTAAALAFANPLFTFLLVVLATLLTAVNIAFAVLVIFAWPALLVLLGEHSLLLFIDRAGLGAEPTTDDA